MASYYVRRNFASIRSAPVPRPKPSGPPRPPTQADVPAPPPPLPHSPPPSPVPTPVPGVACNQDFAFIAGDQCADVTALVRSVGLDQLPAGLTLLAPLRDDGRSNLPSRLAALCWIATASFLACASHDPEVVAIVRGTPGRLHDYLAAWWWVKSYSETAGTFKLDSHNKKTGYDDYGLWQIIRKTGDKGAKRAAACVPPFRPTWVVPGASALNQALIAGSVATGFFDLMDTRLSVGPSGDLEVKGTTTLAKVWKARLAAIDSALASAMLAMNVSVSGNDMKALRLITVLDCSWSAGPGVSKPAADVWLRNDPGRGSYVTRSAGRVALAAKAALGDGSDPTVASLIKASVV